MSRYRPAKPALPLATKRVLLNSQDRQTIRMALLNGATATPIGPVTHIRLPGRQDSMQFPTALVDEVERSMAATDARAAGLRGTASGVSDGGRYGTTGEGTEAAGGEVDYGKISAAGVGEEG